MIEQKLPRFIHLSASEFLYPVSDPQIKRTCPQIHKELHFSFSEFFLLSRWRDHVWGQNPNPHPTPLPQKAALFETVCQSVKSAPCPVCSAHVITRGSLFLQDLAFPKSEKKEKPSLNLITLMFHQVERSGRRHVGFEFSFTWKWSSAAAGCRKKSVSWNLAVMFLFCHLLPQIYSPATFFSKDLFLLFYCATDFL